MRFRNYLFQNFPFLEDDFDALTDYQLFCKMIGYMKKMSKQFDEFQKQLDEYKNYFDNLDVQDEIDKKLDEMATNGDLAEIITLFLSLTSLTFNTVADMKLSENLVADSYVKTLGFYSAGDKGDAYYHIREKEVSDTADDITLFDLYDDSLIAELVITDFNILKFGAKTLTDSTDQIKKVLTLVNNGDVIIIPNGTYTITEPLYITKSITIIGDSVSTNGGSRLSFDGTNGLVLQNGYIDIKYLDVLGNNKEDYSNVDIDNNTFGTVGIVNEYSDSHTSGGCTLEYCNIHGFNVGILIYSTITNLSSKWSGAYRSFIKTTVSYNDIGFLIKDGATYNKIIDSIITSNSKYGIYADTNTFYQNVEVIATSFEVNGFNGSFVGDIKYYGIYAGNRTKIKLTNSYLEQTNVYVNKGGLVVFDACHIHSNVNCFGVGNIISNESHSVYNNTFDYGKNLEDNATSTGLTLTNVYGTGSDALRVQSSSSGYNVLNLPALYTITIPLEDVECLKFECDVKVASGYTLQDFGIYPDTRLTGYGDSGYDNISATNNYSLYNMDIVDSNWHHLTFYMRARIGVDGYITHPENDIYAIQTNIYFTNNSSSLSSDFTDTNLDMRIENPRMTVIAKTRV